MEVSVTSDGDYRELLQASILIFLLAYIHLFFR